MSTQDERDDAQCAVVTLGVYVPAAVREAARLAYVARIAHDRATAELSASMRALSKALKRARISPDKLRVGSLTATSLVPASHFESGEE